MRVEININVLYVPKVLLCALFLSQKSHILANHILIVINKIGGRCLTIWYLSFN